MEFTVLQEQSKAVKQSASVSEQISCVSAEEHTQCQRLMNFEPSLSDKRWRLLCIQMLLLLCNSPKTRSWCCWRDGGVHPFFFCTALPPSSFFSGRCRSPTVFFVLCILPSSHPSLPSYFFVSSSCWHELHFLLGTSVPSFPGAERIVTGLCYFPNISTVPSSCTLQNTLKRGAKSATLVKTGAPASFLTRWNWAQNNKLTSPKMGRAISWPGLLCNLHFLNLAALLWSCALFWTLLLLYFRIPFIFYFVSIISYSSCLELLMPHFSAVVSSGVLQCFRNNLGFYRNIWKHDGFEKT